MPTLKLVPRKTTRKSYAYFYEIKARTGFRPNIADTMGALTYRRPGSRRASTHPVDAVVRHRTRVVKKPWYFHGTIRIARGGKLAYVFRMPLRAPISVPGARIVAFRYLGSCRAAVR